LLEPSNLLFWNRVQWFDVREIIISVQIKNLPIFSKELCNMIFVNWKHLFDNFNGASCANIHSYKKLSGGYAAIFFVMVHVYLKLGILWIVHLYSDNNYWLYLWLLVFFMDFLTDTNNRSFIARLLGDVLTANTVWIFHKMSPIVWLDIRLLTIFNFNVQKHLTFLK
jgi:hypothetical protein